MIRCCAGLSCCRVNQLPIWTRETSRTSKHHRLSGHGISVTFLGGGKACRDEFKAPHLHTGLSCLTGSTVDFDCQVTGAAGVMDLLMLLENGFSRTTMCSSFKGSYVELRAAVINAIGNDLNLEIVDLF